MSYRIKAWIICDSCGEELESPCEHRITHAKSTVWFIRDFALRCKWVCLSRGRYRTEVHYCGHCADKPILKKQKQAAL